MTEGGSVVLGARAKFPSRKLLRLIERFRLPRVPRDGERGDCEACCPELLSSHQPYVSLILVRLGSEVDRESIGGTITKNEGAPGF